MRGVVKKAFGGQQISGSTDFRLGSIEPTESYAEVIQDITNRDVADGNHPHPDSVANPDNPAMVAIQIQKMIDNPEFYSGMFKDDELLAFMKLTEWKEGDQAPYLTFGEKLGKLRGRLGGPQVTSEGVRPLGIQGIGAIAEQNSLERAMLMGDLIDFSIFQADNNETPRAIVIPLHSNDQVAPVVIEKGFERTNLTGRSVEMRQRLYIRRALALTTVSGALEEFQRESQQFDD
ncbi:MAG: hypothetical protein JWM52_74 [Candidatus Saccharibacteria bacterium]|nr:hypothetical protein [Candidatus Saccharibacteria bacterium]